jgi:branched-chain amino acid transport system ATP-binding protein
MDILETKSLSISFGGVKAVDNVSIKLEQGAMISIIGPNGAGKTTLFNLVTGIYSPNSGDIILDGESLKNMSQNAITNAGIARTFQNIRLFKGLSVLENVMTAHDPLLKYNFFQAIFNTPKKRRMDEENRELSMKYLELCGLADYAEMDPLNLPYGIQRKLEIARALATKPKVLLLDEPAAGLNPAEVDELVVLIKLINKKLNLSIITIEHRMKVVMSLSSWIYVLNFGQMLAEGTPSQIQNNADVARAYIGEEGK